MFRKRVLIVSAVAAAAALSLSGCAVKGRTQRIDIECSTEGSKIAVYDKNNKKILGAGSSVAADLWAGNINSGGVYLVEITKEGYEPLTTLIGPDFNATRGTVFWGGGAWTLDNLSPRIINADLESGTITVFNRSDWYSTIKYGMPLGGMPQWGYIYGESGRIWRNGAFCGTDLDFGIGYSDNRGKRIVVLAGYGFDAGFVNDLPVEADLKLVYGGAVGYWFTLDYDGYNDEINYNYNLLAPLVKLRWKFLELSYRGLLGFEFEHGTYRTFGWNNHQLALGLYFEGSRRNGVTLRRSINVVREPSF